MAPERATPAAIARRRGRIAEIALALPETTAEGEQHVGFSVRRKRFAGPSRSLPRPGLRREAGVARAWLDLPGIDWDEVSLVLRDAHRLAAPARLRANLDEGA